MRDAERVRIEARTGEERKWQQTLCESRVSGASLLGDSPSNLGRFLPKRQDSIKL
jgi:hypothetical protein